MTLSAREDNRVDYREGEAIAGIAAIIEVCPIAESPPRRIGANTGTGIGGHQTTNSLDTWISRLHTHAYGGSPGTGCGTGDATPAFCGRDTERR
jgi:hypothetical protein